MTKPKLVTTDATTAAAAGFPVTVRLDGYEDGPLVLSHPTWASVQNYTVTGGTAEATNRERLDALLAVGGVPLIRASEAGDGTPTPE